LWLLFDKPINPMMLSLFGVSLIGGLAALLLRIEVGSSWQGRLAAFVRRASQSWALLAQSRDIVPRLVVLQLVTLLLRAARLQMAFSAIGQPVNYCGVLVASLIADLTMLVSITPMALGLREGAITYAAQLMGTTPSIALAAAVIDRLVWTVGVLVVGQVGVWQLDARGDTGALDVADETPARA
jgi:uncharacterized protein (TIRG00374 family)